MHVPSRGQDSFASMTDPITSEPVGTTVVPDTTIGLASFPTTWSSILLVFDATGVTSMTRNRCFRRDSHLTKFRLWRRSRPGAPAPQRKTPIVTRWQAPLAVARFRAAPEQVPRLAVGLTPRQAEHRLRRVPGGQHPIAGGLGCEQAVARADVSIRLRIDLVMMVPPRISSRVACPPAGSVAHSTGERARAHVQSQGTTPDTGHRWQRFRLTLAGSGALGPRLERRGREELGQFLGSGDDEHYSTASPALVRSRDMSRAFAGVAKDPVWVLEESSKENHMATRTTHRSSAGKKLYAVRDTSGHLPKDIRTLPSGRTGQI